MKINPVPKINRPLEINRLGGTVSAMRPLSGNITIMMPPAAASSQPARMAL